MTVNLLQAIRVGGIEQPAGATLTLPPGLEAQLVSDGKAAFAVTGSGVSTAVKRALAQRTRSGGLRTVLGFDSMTSQFNPDISMTSATYDAATGVLTLNKSSHGIADGWDVDLFHTNLTYTSLRKHLRLTAKLVDASNFTVQLPPNLADLPSGALSGGTCFCRATHMYGSNSWVLRLQQLLSWPFNIIANAAQSGDTTADVLARLDDYVLCHDFDVFMGQCAGINDLALPGATVESVWANLSAILDRLIERNVLLIIGTITPCRTPETLRVGKQNGARVVEINRRLREKLAGANAVVIDSYGSIVDVDDAEGEADTGVLKTNDGVHYQNAGAFRVGRKAATALAPLGLTSFDSRPRAAIDSYAGSQVTASSVTIADGIATFNATAHGFRTGDSVLVAGAAPAGVNGRQTITATANAFTFPTTATGTVTGTVTASLCRQLFPNPVLTTASGGAVQNNITGTVAGNLRARNVVAANITAAASVIAQPDGFGNMQRLQVTACAASDFPAIYTEPQSVMNGLLRAGGKYFMECGVRLSSADWAANQVADAALRLAATISGTTYLIETQDQGGTDARAITENTVLHLRTPAMRFPSVPTALYGALVLRPLAGGSGIVSAVNMDLERIGLWEVLE